MDTKNPHNINRIVAKAFLDALAKHQWKPIFEHSDDEHIAFCCGFDFIVNVDIKNQIVDLADDGDADIILQLGDEDFATVMKILRKSEFDTQGWNDLNQVNLPPNSLFRVEVIESEGDGPELRTRTYRYVGKTFNDGELFIRDPKGWKTLTLSPKLVVRVRLWEDD